LAGLNQSQLILDVIYSLKLTNNVTKTVYSFGLQKTIYPDQGKLVNVFSIIPTLTSTLNAYKSPYSAGFLTNLYISNRAPMTTELLNNFRSALHNIPYLFPYERVEINSHGPYESVEHYLTLQLYVFAYTLEIKHFF